VSDGTRQWLSGLGLERYAPLFEENDLALDLVAELGDADLRELGVSSMGHRKTLLRAIEELRRDGWFADHAARETPAAAAAAIGERAPQAERRQLSIMFCDLVGSTELSGRLDPEDLSTVIQRYQSAVTQEVARFEGNVAKLMGDGVLAYFGYPNAHEDDAERAVRAGLAIVERVGSLRLESVGRLRARIGIDTGPVVVGDLIGSGAAQEEAVVGETPNVAARLQGIAPAGAVVIGAGTRALIGETFACAALGAQSLKGVAGPVAAWRVTGERTIDSRFRAHGRDLTRFVGREEEVALLLERWQRAKDGEGQVVLLSGEAGIGKSRILEAVQEALADQPHLRLRYQCSPHYVNSALHPVITQLQRAAGFGAEDAAEAKLVKLENLLRQSSESVEADAALLAALLSLPFEGRYGALELAPRERKARTLDALSGQLLRLAAGRPVLFLFEDAHWIDPTTSELLTHSIERIQGARVLMVITYRPEYVAPWLGHGHVSTVTLNRLSRAQCRALVTNVAAEGALTNQVVQKIVERADGIPLFLEELTKTILESAGGGPAAQSKIPATLHDSLMSRLDRLGPVKELAQIGAVIGREFPHALLEAVAPMRGRALDDALDMLVASELVFRRGVAGEATFVFKHALIQDAAYESLLRRRRQQLHARIARVLSERGTAAPELLAHHYTEAGLVDEAIRHWRLAGERAAQRFANAEAISHLDRALSLVAALPADRSRDQQEAELLLLLGPVLMGSLGWGNERVRTNYARAQALLGKGERPADLFIARWGLWMHHQARSQHASAERLADALLEVARRAGDQELLLQAHHATWTTNLYTGRLDAAREHARQGLALYQPEVHGHHAFVYAGHDPGVCGHSQNALALWLLGYPEQAMESSRRALDLAEQLRHPPTLAHAHIFAARLNSCLPDPDEAEARARSALEIAERMTLPVYELQGAIISGWARARRSSDEAGVRQMHEAIQRSRGMSFGSAGAHMAGLLAEAWIWRGRAGEALSQIDDALLTVESTGECYWEAELHRLAGLAHQLRPAADAAEAAFRRAIEVSYQQQARSLELRAVTSLARLLRARDQGAAAREPLAATYAWFSEGFDTPDLMDARSVLDELA